MSERNQELTPIICKQCGAQRSPRDYWTCRACGHTEWRRIFVTAVVGTALLGIAALSLLIPATFWRYTTFVIFGVAGVACWVEALRGLFLGLRRRAGPLPEPKQTLGEGAGCSEDVEMAENRATIHPHHCAGAVPIRLDHVGVAVTVSQGPGYKNTVTRHNIGPTIWVERPLDEMKIISIRCHYCGAICKVGLSSRKSVVGFSAKLICWGAGIGLSGLGLYCAYDLGFAFGLIFIGALCIVFAPINAIMDRYADIYAQSKDRSGRKPHDLILKDNIDGMFPQQDLPGGYWLEERLRKKDYSD